MSDRTPPDRDINPFSRPHPARALFREQPALAVSAAYVVLSAVGILFSYAFYRRFNVNVFNFSEISDFLMSVLREPLSLVLAGGALGVVGLLRGINYLEWRHFRRHPPKTRVMRLYYRLSRPAWANPWVDAFAVIAYAWLFISLYTEWRADRIKSAEAVEYVRYEIGGAAPREAVFLGATNRFIFTFDPATGEVEIMPHESLARVLIGPRPVDGGESAAGAEQR